MSRSQILTVLLLFGILSIVLLAISVDESAAYHDLGFDNIGILKINDTSLSIKEVAGGLDLPTNMAFLGPNDILVLEKNSGTVRRIINGNLLAMPLIDVNVANKGEMGMLGITISKKQGNTYVFLYFTEARSSDGGKPSGNVLYRYELTDNKLTNPKLLLKLPATPGQYHQGGTLSVGPDGFIYVSIGDIRGGCGSFTNESCPNNDTYAENNVDGLSVDGRAGILRLTSDGGIANGYGILGSSSPLNLYYAYGIRNSFGMDFDPLTGKLWDTENGPDWGDEINLVEPGFNSGWHKVQGKWSVLKDEGKGQMVSQEPLNLTNFERGGKYSSPKFIWNNPVGPTALVFLNSSNYGKKYENSMFVGDSNYGRIYNFKLTENRTELFLKGPLADKIADTDAGARKSVFAENFGIITDLKIGPDGLLYVLTYGAGKIFKILPEPILEYSKMENSNRQELQK